MSTATSATSNNRFPEAWRTAEAWECPTLVIATALAQRDFMSIAISTGAALVPEFETTLAASPGWTI